MGIRKIPVQITNEYVKGAGVAVGAAGSHNDVVLEIEFSDFWEGLTKKITWLDATGGNPTITVLTADMLKTGTTNVYLVPIPFEPKAYAGDMSMTIRGVTVSGERVTRATLSAVCTFRVLDSAYDDAADEGGDVNATQAEQIQAQIDTILGTISDATGAATEAVTAKAAAMAAQAAAEAAQGLAESAQAAAENARAGVESAQALAEAAQEGAESARAAAVSAQEGAETAAAAAVSAQKGAENARAAAESAQEGAEAASESASANAAAAASSASAASTNAAAATSSAEAAAGYASAAAAAKSGAQTASESAVTAADTATTKAAEAAVSKDSAFASAEIAIAKAAEVAEAAEAAAANTAAAAASAEAAASHAGAAAEAKSGAQAASESANAAASTATTKAAEAAASTDSAFASAEIAIAKAAEAAEAAEAAASGGVSSFNGRSGTVAPQSGDYTADMVGLGNVDNTADMDKPVSAAMRAALDGHTSDQNNPHGVTAAMVGLGNVPNVSTNGQTPTFTQALGRTNVASGDTLAVLFGKIKKYFNDLGTMAFKSSVAKSDLASDVRASLGKADSALQSFTESDPTVPEWAKAASKPSYTASEVGAAATVHTHGAADVSGGALGAMVQANQEAAAALGAAQVRDIHAGTVDLEAGASPLATGAIYLVYEE